MFGAPNTRSRFAERAALGACVFGAMLLPPHAPPARRWVLVYAGSRKDAEPPYTTRQFEQIVTHVDRAGRPDYWLFGGAIFLHLWAPSGRVFTTWIGGAPATGSDWTEYLDTLFVAGGVLSRLDSAVRLASETLGPPPRPFRVSIMIPYPTPSEATLEFAGASFALDNAEGRLGVATAYVGAVDRRFREARLPHLELDGCYWLREEARGFDTALIQQVAAVVHARGLRFLWIPYYAAENWDHWRALGFDAAWLQPNYFFDTKVAPMRLDSAAKDARRNGMGLEVEFNGRLTTTPGFESRLDPYLATLERDSALRTGEVTVYEGGGALFNLMRSRRARDRAVYDRLGAVLR